MFLPQMLNLHEFNAVSFSKGCYLGQEVVARAQHRGEVKRRLFVASHNDENLRVGDRIETQHGEKAVVVAVDAQSALVVLTPKADDVETRFITEKVA